MTDLTRAETQVCELRHINHRAGNSVKRTAEASNIRGITEETSAK